MKGNNKVLPLCRALNQYFQKTTFVKIVGLERLTGEEQDQAKTGVEPGDQLQSGLSIIHCHIPNAGIQQQLDPRQFNAP